MSEIKKHTILGALLVIGCTLFLALCSEVEGSVWKIILTKVVTALALGLTAFIGKVLKDNDMLPDMEDK